MIYRVFDTSINRLFAVYDTEEKALALVRTLIGANGADYADDLAVGCEQADGSFAEPLTGAALLARVEEVATQRKRAPATHVEAVGASRGSGSRANG